MKKDKHHVKSDPLLIKPKKGLCACGKDAGMFLMCEDCENAKTTQEPEYLPQDQWGPTGPGAPCYHIRTDYGLRKLCEMRNVSGYSEMNRDEMLKKLHEQDEAEWNNRI